MKVNPQDRVIRTVVDPTRAMLGDVIIAKRTYFDGGGRLESLCTSCDDVFPTSFRRMERITGPGKRRVEVRNVPQCPACRNEASKRAKLRRRLATAFNGVSR